MKTEKIFWRTAGSNDIREEVREQVTTKIWKSRTDGRLYVKTMFNTWYDITDTPYHKEERLLIK